MSKGSGSESSSDGGISVGYGVGLVVGEVKGEVCKARGMFSEVSKTKKASPPSPSFMEKFCLASLTVNSTLVLSVCAVVYA
jgi:hypothetical protein